MYWYTLYERQQRRRLYLLTPLPLTALRNGGNNPILLARGAMQLPLMALYNPTGAFECFCLRL